MTENQFETDQRHRSPSERARKRGQERRGGRPRSADRERRHLGESRIARLYTENGQTLQDPFSAVSKPEFAEFKIQTHPDVYSRTCRILDWHQFPLNLHAPIVPSFRTRICAQPFAEPRSGTSGNTRSGRRSATEPKPLEELS